MESRAELSLRVANLIAEGEGATLEFKSSFRWDHRLERVNKDLTKSVLKSIAALMNASGGTLLIGVNDEGEPVGLEADIGSLSKQTLDGFELALRDAIAAHLGQAVDAAVDIRFTPLAGITVAVVDCGAHHQPVYLADGKSTELYVRAGNRSSSLDVAAAISYASRHWQELFGVSRDDIRHLVADTLQLGGLALQSRSLTDNAGIPTWLHVATRRVLDLYLANLARSSGWRKLVIVSPWISDVDTSMASMSTGQLVRRLEDEDATLYLVTRPPVQQWHRDAVTRLADSGRANIAYLPDLHVKLFTAQTTQSSFAMLGSANFTSRSLLNRELGVLATSVGEGRLVVDQLEREAISIYRNEARTIVSQVRFGPGRG
jgi:hypothetical protein